MAKLTGEDIIEQVTEEIENDIGINITESFFISNNETKDISIVLIPEDKPWHIVLPTTFKAQ